MKLFILIAICVGLSFNAFAGGRHIYCDGEVVQADIAAKGPRPYGKVIGLKGLGQITQATEIYRLEDNNSYDVKIIYQSIGGNTVPILEYVAGQHQLKVYKETELIEDVSCVLGF